MPTSPQHGRQGTDKATSRLSLFSLFFDENFTKKSRNFGATFNTGRLRCEKCAKSRVSRFRSKVASSSLGRFFLGNFRGRGGWGARRSRANKAKVKANPNHSRSLVFSFSLGPLDRRHGPSCARAADRCAPRRGTSRRCALLSLGCASAEARNYKMRNSNV